MEEKREKGSLKREKIIACCTEKTVHSEAKIWRRKPTTLTGPVVRFRWFLFTFFITVKYFVKAVCHAPRIPTRFFSVFISHLLRDL